MITVNAVLTLDGKKIVPVRAIPFVTGGDMSPKCLATILSDPKHWFLAFVLGANDTVTQMLPKNWKQHRDLLEVMVTKENDLDLANRAALEILPASTFVYWEALWRTHENCFLPDRREIERLPTEDQANYELRPTANIPRALVDMVFEGFSSSPKVKPISRAEAQDHEILSVLADHGFDAKRLPKNAPGKPGVKSLVRIAVGKCGMWGGAKVFDKAWERLLRNGDIVTTN